MSEELWLCVETNSSCFLPCFPLTDRIQLLTVGVELGNLSTHCKSARLPGYSWWWWMQVAYPAAGASTTTACVHVR